jgi:hypothetical protein
VFSASTAVFGFFSKPHLNGKQAHEVATRIANDRMDKGFFDSTAAFQSDAMRFDSEIPSTTRAMACSLQSMNHGWSSRRSKLNSGN